MKPPASKGLLTRLSQRYVAFCARRGWLVLLLLRFRKVVQRRAVRLAAGSLVLTFGVVGLFNASTLGGRLWQGIVCHT